MHQLPEDDEDYQDELFNLGSSWKLPADLSRERKRVFVPICDQFGASRNAFVRVGGGNHWSLLLWEIGRKEEGHVMSFRHFDSSSGFNQEAARSVARKLGDVLNSRNKNSTTHSIVVECKTPQQYNGYDCGLMALGLAEALSLQPFGVGKSEQEKELHSQFELMGGKDKFASNLRKRIANDIRELASASK